MNNYTIPCTEEQTRKALELGAPIEEHGRYHADLEPNIVLTDDKTWLEIPTAEEMIGWLETMIYKIYIDSVSKTGWYYIIYIDEESSISHAKFYNSRKEATLAAIDAVLEYLSNKK